ncbi:hypothetical protein BGX24_008043, partial [Mortierella sp. AD032]
MDKVAGAQNDLGRELRKTTPKAKHVDCLLSSLERLAIMEPKVEHHRLSFKDRLEKVIQASERSSSNEEIFLRRLHDQVDEIDEEAEQDEDDKEEQRTPTSNSDEKEPS